MPPQEPSRVSLVDVVGRDTIRVSLERDGRVVVGEAHVGDAGGLAEAGARAALAAVETLTPGAVTFGLDWCGVVPTAPELPEVVLVLVGLEVAGVPMRYAGAVTVDTDALPEVGARAALDALNRRLEIMQI